MCPVLNYKSLLENQVRHRHLYCISSPYPPTKTWPQKPNIMSLSEINPICMDCRRNGSGVRPGKDQPQQLRKCGLGKEQCRKFLSPGIYHPLLKQNQKFRVLPFLCCSINAYEKHWQSYCGLTPILLLAAVTTSLA